MAVTSQSFLDSFSQFGGGAARIKQIEIAITRASNVAGPAFGDMRDQAIEWLTAHYLSIDPNNENMAQVKGMPATTTYEQEYLKLVRACRPVGPYGTDSSL
jgi:hypothetical protein